MNLVYPNQKIVTVHKEPADRFHPYGILNKGAMYSAARELTHNELRLFLYLSTNQPEYCMALSTSDVAAKMGSTEDGIRKAVNGLKNKGYIVLNQGRCFDFYEVAQTENDLSVKETSVIMQDLSPVKVPQTNTKDSVYKAKRKGEIIKENTKENIIDYKKKDLLVQDSSEWDMVLGRIKVKCYSHTQRKLENAAGCTPDAKVVGRIISQNWQAFEKGLDEQEGYRFNTLINLVNEQYRKWEHVIAVEEAEYISAIEERRNEPRINYDALRRKEPEQEGLGDISDLLDEVFGDCDDVS